MNFWLTTHWPPRIDDDPTNIANGIWLPNGREMAGSDLRKGDKVLVYQSHYGRPEIRKRIDGTEEIVPSIKGKEGIIAICEVQREISEYENSEPTKYIDGSVIWWRWYTPLIILSKSGFVQREKMNTVLGYKLNFNLRGFGDLHSGLKKIKEDQFYSLVKIFKGNIEILSDKTNINSGKHTKSDDEVEESEEHFLLKIYVAYNSMKVFKENNIQTLGIEYQFPTNDRADILLLDELGRILGVEIEVSVGDDQIEGPLQAIKYRYMSELVTKRKLGDSRAILIAYKISDKAKLLCNEYDIQCIEVDESIVKNWSLSDEGKLILVKHKRNTKI